jgi:hypothetical protein
LKEEVELKLSQLLRLSKDKEIAPDFAARLMTKLLQQEHENTVMQVMLGMQIGWVMGAASASQDRISTKIKKAYTYTDYVNRGRSQHVVCYDATTSRYIDIVQNNEE